MKNFSTAKHVFQIMEPSSKRSRITDFFQKLPSNPAVSTPEYPAFLRRFRPIDVLRHSRSRVCPCRLSPELQATSTDEASMPPAADENNSAATNQSGTYKSYSLRKKLDREQAFTRDTSNYSALLGFLLKFWILPPIIWASKSEMFKKVPEEIR